ncbi:MAG: DUF4435 domain-containing protein [Hoeflea sp.]|uniref:DUF4435 domain-containing protein n=1 Tax=Hoeflea sp. TaxID=1940281 RepID=UPI0032988DA0
MIFERTRSGQINRAAFHGVDYTCYVEGGGGISEFSEDVLFWNTVFDTLRPDIRVHCIARGGKAQLESRARSLITEDIQNTLVAMDSDYDDLLGDKIEDSRVLYTFGYSWENDAFSPNALLNIYAHLVRANVAPADEGNFILTECANLERKLKWPVRADFLALISTSSILPRDAPGRIVKKHPTNGLPQLQLGEVIKLCKHVNLNTRPRNFSNTPKEIPATRYCVGHVFTYCVHLIVGATKFHFGRGKGPSPVHFRDIGLLQLTKFLREALTDPIVVHYRSACTPL